MKQIHKYISLLLAKPDCRLRVKHGWPDFQLISWHFTPNIKLYHICSQTTTKAMEQQLKLWKLSTPKLRAVIHAATLP